MVLEEDPDELIKEIGHDGQEVWWPDLVGSIRKRGLHIQELQTIFARRGLLLSPIEIMPRSAPSIRRNEARTIWKPDYATNRFCNLIQGKKGIIIGAYTSGHMHACAWDGHILYDPNGLIQNLEDMLIKECWLVSRIESK